MKRKINRLLINITLLTTLSGLSPWVLALRDDASKPINIESDQQQLDIQHNIVTFTGNVVLTQGSIKIHADKIIVTRPAGEKGKEVMDGYGNPATFYQMQDNGKPIQGHALHMRYQTAQQRVELTGKALLKQLDSSISGDRIVYLVQQQHMQAFSNKGKRVTTVLLPSQLQDNAANQRSSEKNAGNKINNSTNTSRTGNKIRPPEHSE